MIDLDFWKNKVAELEEECVEKQNEIEELESDNENLKNEIEELEKKIIKAQSEIQEWHDEAIAVRKNRDEMLANFRKGIEPYVDLQDIHDKIAQLQDRHQQDCITINQLNVTIDVLLDKMERLRNNKSMVLKCLSDFTE